MAGTLTIRDGVPQWWMSPDVWVVPGADPNGTPGMPVAGHPAFLWAHVANTASANANGARVDFFWANPALQVLRSTATMIGSAFGDIPAGGSQDVLCLVPWTPVVVNGGHECVVASVVHPSDPLPPGPPEAFDPPAYNQVAQRNLSVLTVAAKMALPPLLLTLSAPAREDKRVRVTVESGGELAADALRRLGLVGLRPARGAPVVATLQREASCEPDSRGAHELDVHVARGAQAAVYVSVRGEGLAASEYQLIHVVERRGDAMLGGYSLIVVSRRAGEKP